MFKSEIMAEAQPFCDISMVSTDGWVRSTVTGWASHRSLIAHRLMLVSCSAAGGRDEYSLSEDGRQFLIAMLRKWPYAAAEARGSEIDGRGQLQERQPRQQRKRWANGLLRSGDVSGGRMLASVPTPQ